MDSSTPKIRVPFPNRTAENTRDKSPEDLSYNCFGWALGEIVIMAPRHKWPEGAALNMRVDSVVQAYELLGFEKADSAELEDGIEKIAVYGTGEWADHAARQTESGQWTSKLGLAGKDVEHDSLDAVSGGVYGSMIQILKHSRK